jgi:glycosyltransferase involved in cell wall biosynthesis
MSVPILFEIHPASFGGTERFLSLLLPRLDRRRFAPIAIAPKAGEPLARLAALGVPTVVVDHYFSQRGIRAMAEVIRTYRIDLVQSNYYASHLAMAANLAGVPHIWRLGGHVGVGSGARTRADEHLTLEMIRLLSSAIVCNSQFIRSQFGRSLPKSVVIHNGVERSSLRRRRDASGPLRVGMVAHFTAQKRHEDFIEAAAMVGATRSDVTFTLLGRPYPHGESRRYAARIRRLAGQVPGITVEGFSDGTAASDFDVVVLPSIGESLSNAILEAMAAGVPVVAARSGGNAELVGHNTTGLLVPPRQPRALARAIVRLLDDPAARFAMGSAARTAARSRFSLDVCTTKYERLYDSILTP